MVADVALLALARPLLAALASGEADVGDRSLMGLLKLFAADEKASSVCSGSEELAAAVLLLVVSAISFD